MLLEGAYLLSRTENATPKRLLGNGYKGGGEEQSGCRIFARRKVDLFDCCVRPARLRISYGNDVIVFAERHGLHCGETVLAVVEGTGLACLRVESL